jgi:cyclomaltodextrinase / maltogenic alpha-amylase / neopullulanase
MDKYNSESIGNWSLDMPHYHHRTLELDGNNVLLKLELESSYPQEPQLLLRADNDACERPLCFEQQTNGHDDFSIRMNATVSFEYALRVNRPDQSWWITPKGEEHDGRPHNWFLYVPQSGYIAEGGQMDMDLWPPEERKSTSLLVTPDWVRDAIFYQIFIDRFARSKHNEISANVQPWGTRPTNTNFMGGNLSGVHDRLDYLVDLGITALYFTPIFKGPSNHKYDTTDYFTVDPEFGDLKLLQELVGACHVRGLRVILDGVFNHCSEQHPFFLDVKRHGRKSRYYDWFHIRNWPIPDRFDDGEATKWYDCWWGFHTLPKFNHYNPEVEEYFLKVGTHWLQEADIDGWRLDVPNEITSGFWPKFRRAVKTIKPDAYIVGEIWDDATPWLQGDQFDAVMNYRFQRALLSFFAEGRPDANSFNQTLTRLLQDYPESATNVMLNLLGSHDTARPMSIVAQHNGGANAHAFESLKLMITMQFAWAGAPCIFYGDEIGMEGNKDPDCRRCFPWNWENIGDEYDKRSLLLAYYKKLIAIRKGNPALRHGRFRTLQAESLFYAFERRTDDNHCIVAINQGVHERIIKLPSLPGVDLLGGQPIENNQISVPAHRAAIVRFATLTATAPALPDASVEPELLDIDFVSGHAV